MFGARQVIAVEDLDAVTRQGGGAARFELPQHLGEPPAGRPDQAAADRRLGPLEFLVDCGEGRRDAGGIDIGAADRWLDAADDHGDQFDDGGEEQLAGVLARRGALEHPIQFLGIERLLHEKAEEDGHRGIQDESLEHVAKQHDPLHGKRDLQSPSPVISIPSHLGRGTPLAGSGRGCGLRPSATTLRAVPGSYDLDVTQDFHVIDRTIL